MRNILTIAGKDIRVYLTTWVSYALFGFFLLMTAFFFTTLVEQYQQIYMQAAQQPWMQQQLNLTDVVMGNILRNISVFFLFLLPLLTMRLFAEERKSNTLELLMTVPVRPAEIVLGKYLAAITIMTIMLALTFIFPLLLHVYGGAAAGQSPLDFKTVIIGYVGMFCLGASFIAIGLLASALTSSQIVAAITSFSLLLMFFVIGYASRGKEGFWQGFFEYISITNHLEDFIKGVVKVTGIVYYASLAFVGLFLTYRVVEAQRWR
ncbi:MAG: ABC transporter permease subunit [Deltaproteobacteria bacterium]|nr:ABC transporter permease subunit [Deltaproteobacteria bacterium]